MKAKIIRCDADGIGLMGAKLSFDDIFLELKHHVIEIMKENNISENNLVNYSIRIECNKSENHNQKLN